MLKLNCRTEPGVISLWFSWAPHCNRPSLSFTYNNASESRVPQLLDWFTADAGSTLRAIYSILAQQTKPFFCLDANLMSWPSECFMGSLLQGSQPFIYGHSLCGHCHLSLVEFPAAPSEPPSAIWLWTPQAVLLLPTCFIAAPVSINTLLKALASEDLLCNCPQHLQSLPSSRILTGLPFHSFPLIGGTAGEVQLFPSTSSFGNEVITSALLEPWG